MATITTAQSGNFDATATWVGGVVPVDGDAIVIAAGHVLTWNVDKSAWTTGVAGITITSAEGTPAQLTVPTSGGPYVLPLKTGTSIQGTNAANKGQLYIGSAGTPIPNTTYIKLDLFTTAQIVCQYLDVQIFGTEPANKFVRTLNAESAAATVIETDTDVSADWAAGDLLIFANTRAASNSLQTATIQSISGSTITLTAGLTYAVNAGAYLVKANRNVEIVSSIASFAQVISVYQSSVPGTWQCAIRQATQARTGYGAGTTSVTASPAIHTFSGIISGFSAGLVDAMNAVIIGVIANVSSMIAATSLGVSSGYKISGPLIGASGSGINCRAGLLTPTSLIACCNFGVRGELNDIAGTVIGCVTGIDNSSAILRRGSVIGGSGNDANTRDISTPVGVVWGYGTSLRSATQVGQYLFSEDKTPGPRVLIQDYADGSGVPQPGYLAWWTHGGKGATEAYSAPTHGTPPWNTTTIPYVHRSTFESAAARNYWETEFTVPAGATLTIHVYARKSATGMTATPKFRIIDPNREWGHASEALAEATMTDNADTWQTHTLTHQNTGIVEKPVLLRVQGTNASGTMFWNYDSSFGGAAQTVPHIIGA